MLFLGPPHPSAAVEGLGVKKEKAGRHVVQPRITHIVASLVKKVKRAAVGCGGPKGQKRVLFGTAAPQCGCLRFVGRKKRKSEQACGSALHSSAGGFLLERRVKRAAVGCGGPKGQNQRFRKR